MKINHLLKLINKDINVGYIDIETELWLYNLYFSFNIYLMKYILSYKKFLEGNFFQNSKIINKIDSDLYKELDDIKKLKFKNDKKLLSKFTSKKYYNKRKMILNILWNEKENHCINYRIENRSSFKSIIEFNEYLKQKLNILLPEHISDMDTIGKYTLYDSERNISIIIYNDLKYVSITIITIINGFSDDMVEKVIYI